MSDSSLEDDIIWVYHRLPTVKDLDDTYKIKDAPSPGSVALLQFAFENRKEFFARHLATALKRKQEEGTLKDDHRRLFDVFEQIDEQLVEEWNAKRQCPFCLQPLKRATFLLPGAQRSREEPGLSHAGDGSGDT